MRRAASVHRPVCHRCGEPTSSHDLRHADDLTAEVIALLAIGERTGVACTGCVEKAEREIDTAEEDLALESDPTFAEVCDARHEGYLAHAMQHQGEYELVARAA